MEEERTKQLLMGLMDGELDHEERREINELLRRSQSLRDEYEVLKGANEALNLLSQTNIDEALLRKVWRSPFRRTLRLLSYGMIGTGFLCMLGLGIVQYLAHGEGNLLVNVSLGGIGVGFILLLAQVVRDRMIVLKSDPYRDIEK